jgi:hypothetical protein
VAAAALIGVTLWLYLSWLVWYNSIISNPMVMSARLFSILIFLGALAAVIGWGLIIFYIDPFQSGLLALSLFYVSFFLSLLGIFFLVGNGLRKRFFKKQLLSKRFSTAVRQAIFFAVLLVGWALLKSQSLARWWVIILFILILTGLEFFFVSFQHQRRSYESQA